MNTNLKSILLGITIAVPICICASEQRTVNAEMYAKEEKPAATVVPRIEYQVEETEYFDVPLSHALQDFIFAECEKHNMAPALIIAMIEQESNFDASAIGDDGASTGLMQIQSKWHEERMDKLGCTDLLNPFENVAVGIDYIAELKDIDSDLYWVLMAYNGGIQYANERMDACNYSDYAVEITERAFELEGGEVANVLYR